MGTKSRDRLYGTSVRMAVERAVEARKQADKLACEAWTKRMLAFKGPAQPSPSLGDALNAGYTYLEVRCLGCDTNQTVAPDIVRRPKLDDGREGQMRPDRGGRSFNGHPKRLRDRASAGDAQRLLSLRWRAQGQAFLLSRPIPVHGVRATHMAREFARH